MKHTDASSPTDHPFHVDLHGVVDLLSRHIYSVPHVFVRELIQNGVDAIAARRSLLNSASEPELTPDDEPRILIRPIHDDRKELSVTDNGIGITADEAVDLLATVGRTSKRDAIGFRRDGYLGQFGIGLLSCFTVATDITVISRSRRTTSAGIRWVGRADGTFTITELSAEQSDALPFGTTVHLTPRGDEVELLTVEAVNRAALSYARYLPTRIDIENQDGTLHRVTEPPPFTNGAHPQNPVESESLRDHASERLGRDPFDIIDLGTSDGRLQGVAYVLPYPTAAHTRRPHSIYSQRMLVAHTDTDLVPT